MFCNYSCLNYVFIGIKKLDWNKITAMVSELLKGDQMQENKQHSRSWYVGYTLGF